MEIKIYINDYKHYFTIHNDYLYHFRIEGYNCYFNKTRIDKYQLRFYEEQCQTCNFKEAIEEIIDLMGSLPK